MTQEETEAEKTNAVGTLTPTMQLVAAVIALVITVLTCGAMYGKMAAEQNSLKETVRKQEAKVENNELLSEQNARDFAFFKGEVNAKLDSIMASMRRQEQFIQNLEIDHGKASSP